MRCVKWHKSGIENKCYKNIGKEGVSPVQKEWEELSQKALGYVPHLHYYSSQTSCVIASGNTMGFLSGMPLTLYLTWLLLLHLPVQMPTIP